MQRRRKSATVLAGLFITSILTVSLIQMIPAAAAVSYRMGSSGTVVKEIQTRLKNWGYYTGDVDGIYGSKTVAAIKYFQSKNGLTQDGIAGPATLEKLGVSAASSASARSNSEYLLARVISAEARGETYRGQVAIGAVILNRVDHPSFPNTIAGVVYQPGAFTCMSDGQFNQPVADSAIRAATHQLSRRPLQGAVPGRPGDTGSHTL